MTVSKKYSEFEIVIIIIAVLLCAGAIGFGYKVAIEDVHRQTIDWDDEYKR